MRRAARLPRRAPLRAAAARHRVAPRGDAAAREGAGGAALPGQPPQGGPRCISAVSRLCLGCTSPTCSRWSSRPRRSPPGSTCRRALPSSPPSPSAATGGSSRSPPRRCCSWRGVQPRGVPVLYLLMSRRCCRWRGVQAGEASTSEATSPTAAPRARLHHDSTPAHVTHSGNVLLCRSAWESAPDAARLSRGPLISPYLPISPRISPYLPISPRISPYLPVSP